jgi:hypothetical protein
MSNAPVFENSDLFDPRRIHLADIDGSGTSDIIYIGHEGISLYFNQSGNFWSPPRRLTHFPRADDLTSIATADSSQGTFFDPLTEVLRNGARTLLGQGG